MRMHVYNDNRKNKYQSTLHIADWFGHVFFSHNIKMIGRSQKEPDLFPVLFVLYTDNSVISSGKIGKVWRAYFRYVVTRIASIFPICKIVMIDQWLWFCDDVSGVIGFLFIWTGPVRV